MLQLLCFALSQCFRRLPVCQTNLGRIGVGLVNFRNMSDCMSGNYFIKDFVLQFENNILSGKLVTYKSVWQKNICLPDRMSGKNLNTFVNTSIIMKLHTKTPRELRMCHFSFGIKGQGCRAYWKWFLSHNCFFFPLNLSSWNFTQNSPLVKEPVPYWFWGQKVRVQGDNALITEMIYGA